MILSSLVAIVVVNLFDDFGQRFQVIIWIGVGVATLYTASMSTLGAMFSVLRSGGQADEAAETSSK